jgi:hypothetical protein
MELPPEPTGITVSKLASVAADGVSMKLTAKGDQESAAVTTCSRRGNSH